MPGAVTPGRRRAGRTDKISNSLDRGDLAWLKKRARRLYRGNVSAVAAGGVRRVREEEGRAALVAWLGETAAASPAEDDAIGAAGVCPALLAQVHPLEQRDEPRLRAPARRSPGSGWT